MNKCYNKNFHNPQLKKEFISSHSYIKFIFSKINFHEYPYLHFLSHVPDIEQLNHVVAGRRTQPVAVGVPLQIHHGRLVGMPGTNTEIIIMTLLISNK